MLEYISTTEVTVKISTDRPGGSMALRATLTFPASGTRTKKQLPMAPTPLQGQFVQFEVYPAGAGELMLFEGSIEYRVIGSFFDGAAGEKWITQPLSFGI